MSDIDFLDAPVPPKHRQQKHVFTAEEDVRLSELVTMMGTNAWTQIEQLMPGRSARQCRERWNLYLSPEISNDPWSAEEDARLTRLYQSLGPRWTAIANHFPKRTANNVKNRQKQLHRRAERVAALTSVPAFGGLARLPASVTQQSARLD
jgi:hypothetical protein